MENKKITGRRSLRGDSHSYYFIELEKSFLERNKKPSSRTSSADKMECSANTDYQSSDLNHESCSESESIDSKSSSENESHDIDETDKKKHRKHKNRQDNKEEDRLAKETIHKENPQPKPLKNAILEIYLQNVVILLVLVLAVAIANGSFGGQPTYSTDSDFNFTKAMADLAKAYPSQLPSTWRRLSFGIEDVKTHSRPTVFLLVHSGSDDSSNLIAKDVGYIAAKYLRSAEKNPLILNANDFEGMTDHGELNTRYKKDLEASGSMVVLDLESTPGKIAQGLRYYCDEYNPLVKSAAIFLTVNLNKCNADLEKFNKGPEMAANGIAEKCLRNSWSKELGPDILQPLLSARIMGIVLKIEPKN